MRFDGLLWECLLPGAHEGEDNKLAAALAPLPGETVLVFRTDSNAFRWRQPQDKRKLCDFLFFYRGPVASRPVLLFTELKGSDYGDPEQQIRNVMEAVASSLDKDYRRSALAGAVIVFGKAVPSDYKRRQKDFLRETRVPCWYLSAEDKGNRIDLREQVEILATSGNRG